MKRFTSICFILSALVLCGSHQTAAQTYTPVTVIGFNVDAIAENSPAINYTSGSIDGSDYVLYSAAYGVTLGTGLGLPDNGTIATGSGTYQLQPYTQNNILYVTEGSTDSLAISTPASFSVISLLAFSTEGDGTDDITVRFTDGSSTVYGGQSIPDWFNGSGSVYSGFDRTGRTTNTPDDNFGVPYMYAINLPIYCSDANKLIKEIVIANTTTTGSTRTCILAVSGITSTSTLFTQSPVICQGQSVTVNGNIYTTSGTYMDTLIEGAASGCDSFVITNLTVKPLATFTQNPVICQGQSFTENGHTYTSTNTYMDTFVNAGVNGCDSIVTTNLTVNPWAYYTQYTSLCQGDTFVESSHHYTTTGVYMDTFVNAAADGCDSVVTTYLVFKTRPSATASANPSTICLGDTSIVSAVPAGDTVIGFSGPFAPANTLQLYGCELTGFVPAHMYIGAFYGACDSSGYGFAISQTGTLNFNWTATDIYPFFGSAPYIQINGVTYPMPGLDTSVFANSTQNASVSIPVTAGDVFTFYMQDPDNDSPEMDVSGLVFTAAPDTLAWYSAATGGALLGTQDSLVVVPSASGTETVYLQLRGPDACYGVNRVPVSITVTPPATHTQNISICQGSSLVINGHTYTITNTYIDTFRNGSVTGCDSVLTTHLTVLPKPTNNIGTGPINQCGGNVVLDAGNVPGSTYIWSNGSTNEIDTFSSSSVVSVIITNSVNCTDTFSRRIFINPVPIVDLGPTQNLCSDSTILDAGNPGEAYLWTGGSTGEFLTVYNSGTYTVTVTDTSSHCSASDSVQINFGTVPAFNLGPDTALCGGTITLSAPAGYPGYLWSTGNKTNQIIASITGTYSVTVTGTGGCTASATVFVSVFPKPDLGPDVTDSICPSSRADLYNYYINSGLTLTYSTPTPATVDTGTYTVIGTNSNGCSDTAYITIIYRQKPNAGGNKTDSICPGYTYDLTALYPNVGYTSYMWNTPDPTAADTGTYMLVVTNASGCTDTAIATITQRLKPNLGGNKTDSICQGYTYDLTTLYPNNGYATYTWTGVANPSAVSVGVYQLIVTNASGCGDTAYATILQRVQPVVTIPSYPDQCSTNPAFPLTGATPPGGTYYVNYVVDSIFRTPVLGPGIYHVLYIYTNASGCTDSASHDVTIYPQPVIYDTIGLPVTCTGSGLIDLNNYLSPAGGVYTGAGISGIYFYPTLAPAGIDTITYVYTDQHGCMDTSVTSIQILPAVKVTLHTYQSNLTICAGQPITFIANGAQFYQFFVNDTARTAADTTNTFTTTTLNNHDQVTVVGSNACSTDTSDYIIIDVIPLPTVTVGPDTTIALGQIVQLYSIVNGSSSLVYLWTPDSSLNVGTIPNPVFSGSDTTILTLTVTDASGCTATANDTINVYVPDNVLLPNVITPNGDGKNDVWALNPKINLLGSHLVIFNRWGELVYETWNYANDWGGTYKSTGQKVPDGTYYFVLTVPAQNNHTYKGPINVLDTEGN